MLAKHYKKIVGIIWDPEGTAELHEEFGKVHDIPDVDRIQVVGKLPYALSISYEGFPDIPRWGGIGIMVKRKRKVISGFIVIRVQWDKTVTCTVLKEKTRDGEPFTIVTIGKYDGYEGGFSGVAPI